MLIDIISICVIIIAVWNHIVGEMVSILASSVVDCVFKVKWLVF
jgi:hypothetical protein